MSEKKILVCGATGFIGRNVAEYFASTGKFEVYGTHLKREPYANSNIKFIRADLTRVEEVETVMRGMDIVIQCAATTSGSKDIVARPYIHVTDNAVMNSLIFRTAHDLSTPNLVFPSCSIMYQPGDTPVREDDFDESDVIHEKYFGAGCTKVYLEKICEFYARYKRTKYTVMRHSNMYGPHDKYDLEKSHVFGATITKVMTATDGKIKVWGTGEEERDLLYISDLINFIDVAISKQVDFYSLVNVGYGSSISIADLVKKIIAESGRDLSIEYDPAGPTIKTKLALDNAKAEKFFGWKPQVSLDEGIKKTIAWYKDNIK